MYFDPRVTISVKVAAAKEQEQSCVNPAISSQDQEVSPLFAKLVATVDRRRLVLDRGYFKLVSEIAELLEDDEVALLALYLAPPLAIGLPAKEHRLALSIMRERRKEKSDA